ncbi:MAG: ATP-binding protein [Anaerolineales bacterium]|nr:ATP-binding protein [Anaerolineales bacterium]
MGILVMVDQIACPRCSQLTNSKDRQCENCGVDLVQAAILAEKTISFTSDIPEGVPIVPEILVPRLGNYLIEKGVLQDADLQKALDYQHQKSELGQACLIGQALIELDIIDRKTLDEAVTEQIIELQSALREANDLLEQRVQGRTAELQHALKKLTDLSQLKSNFVSNVSHELRTPLTHIKGYLDLLSEESLGPLTSHQSEALIVMLKAEARLERLIEDLIQFSLASRGDLSIQIKPFSLNELLEISIAQISNKAKDHQIKITSSVKEQLPKVNADEEKIGWVLMQLLDNAVKFTPEGGLINITAIVNNSAVSVSVADTGIGIPKDRLSEVIEPFHQLDGSITRKYEGTGLGLTMAYRILVAHGSSLEIESIVGKGSQFSFSLPTTDAKYDR